MDVHDTLGRQIIPTLGADRFASAMSGAFDDTADVIPGTPTHYPGAVYYPIGSTHAVLATDTGDGWVWSLYETAEETARRVHLAAWADFARGYWTTRVPEIPGTYPVRNRSGHRGRDHVFVQRGESVYDTDSGFLRQGQKTAWVGQFWNCPYPSLPGAL